MASRQAGPPDALLGSTAPALSLGPEEPVAPETVRWRLVLSYDGSCFHGFAAQPDTTTVAGSLAGAIARVLRLEAPPALTCAGRTDAGVHARGQVVHLDVPAVLPVRQRAKTPSVWGPTELAAALNRQLAPAIVVTAADVAPEGFDARHSATARSYRYLVYNAPAPDPLLAPLSWHIAEELDVRAMRAASDTLIGEHDFRAFCRRVPGTAATDPIVRRVLSADWRSLGPDALDGAPGRLLRFDITAGSFCHQMVRSLVGQLVHAGRGRATSADMMALLRAHGRSGAVQPAPPEGLCLVGVRYGD